MEQFKERQKPKKQKPGNKKQNKTQKPSIYAFLAWTSPDIHCTEPLWLRMGLRENGGNEYWQVISFYNVLFCENIWNDDIFYTSSFEKLDCNYQ